MKNDRRQQPRKIPQALAFIQVEKDEGGRVVNISESGLCFEVFSTIRVTEAVHFWFTFNLSDRIEALGRLVWIDATKKIGGLTFTKLSQSANKQLHLWLGRMPVSEPPVVRDVPSQPPEIRRLNTPLLSPETARASVPSPPPRVAETFATLLPAPKFNPSEKPVRQLTTGGILGYAPESPSDVHLVPLERHRSAARAQFLRGLLVGVGLSAAVAIPVFMSMGSGRSTVTTQQPQKQAPTPDRAISPEAQIADSSPQPTPAAYSPIAQSHDSRTNPSSRTSRDADVFSGVGGSPSLGLKPASSDAPTYDPNSPIDTKRSTKSLGSAKQLWAAVQAGNTSAAVILADHYIHGDGVPLNCDQARVLLLVASEKNNKAAIQKLRDLDKTGCPQTPQTPTPSQ
jgi:hypothetical protein